MITPKKPSGRDVTDDRAYIASLVRPTRAFVVEVGAGDCACLTLVLVRRGFRILAIDQDAAALEDARRVIARARLLRRVRLVQADAGRLPLPPESVETIVTYDALHHAADLRAAVRGMAAALHPRGVLIVGDEDEPGNGFLGRLTQALRAAFQRVAIVPRGEARIYICRSPRSRDGITMFRSRAHPSPGKGRRSPSGFRRRLGVLDHRRRSP